MRHLFTVLLLATAMAAQDHPDPHRTKEIQRALKSAGYHVQVNGHWDGTTSQALIEIAKQHNWQHRAVPDARVIIWLGLGPSTKGLLNPQTAQVASRINQGYGRRGGRELSQASISKHNATMSSTQSP